MPCSKFYCRMLSCICDLFDSPFPGCLVDQNISELQICLPPTNEIVERKSFGESFMCQTPPTVFKSSKWNLLHMITFKCRCVWHNTGSRVMSPLSKFPHSVTLSVEMPKWFKHDKKNVAIRVFYSYGLISETC